jgi:anaerobic selenocysteine-containing dehydrogenase
MKFALASGAAVAAGVGIESEALAGKIKLAEGGFDFNPLTGEPRKKIATACWSCVTRDPMVGYVKGGRLVKIEGQPNSIRTGGKVCAKAHAGVNQVYFPDRVLYPMRRVGERGEGKWKRVSWDEALTELAGRLKKMRDAGHPEKFMFHYGRMKASSSKLIKSVFLANYGTKTISGHTSICEGGKWTAQELTWGKHYDNWDFDNTKFILNFGSNLLEAHTNHIPTATRLISAVTDRNVRMVTFDVRLSNTAAKSSEWVPIKPGTDGAVVMSMCNVIMQEGLYNKDFFKFIKVTAKAQDTSEVKIAALKKHLAQYTPEWAEGISGVDAGKIRALALEFGKTKPSCIVSYRGAVAHYNGNDAERAMQMLGAITGNIDNPGGRCLAVAPKWKYPKGPKNKPKAKSLKITKGANSAIPSHGVCQEVLKMIKDGSHGRPEVYMWYCYNPVYVNGECQENIDILKDEKLIPFTVTSNIVYDEGSALADLILPDTTYLERWDWEDMVSPSQVAEYYIRQPLVKPLGESRDMGDVACELAERMGFPLGFDTKEEFVKKSCEKTPEIKAIGGFEYMKEHGVWHDPKAKPKFFSYKKSVSEKDLKKDGVILDEATGVYWNWKTVKVSSEEAAHKKGYAHTKNGYKGYVGQKIGSAAYKGFKPDKLNKSGYLELYSNLMKDKGFAPLPTYVSIPEHDVMKPNELILTTYKVAVQIHSRSTHCKWLTEIYHENPAWMNPKTAASLGLKNGDQIKVSSEIGAIETPVKVTEGIIPGVIAISFHLGRSDSGRYASGKKTPLAHDNDPDLKNKWWDTYGVNPNWIIPNKADPVNGQMRFMDTVVQVTKV